MTPEGPGGEARARRAARRLTSGVTVLTVAHGGAAHGTTVSAVTAVSREPLLICACLHRGSSFTVLARRSGCFTVNVLSGRQGLLADWFADPSRPAGYAQFALVRWTADPATGAPVLRHSLATFACKLAGCYPGGDHDIVLGEVIAGAPGVGGPLLSFDGRLCAAEVHDVTARRSRGPQPAPATTLE
jgi:flavin reductase